MAVDSARDRSYLWPLIVFAIVLTITSLQPMRPTISHLSFVHGSLHVLAFGLLGVLATRTGFGIRQQLWIALACLLFGLGIETCQHFLGAHQMEWNDVANDGLGIFAVGLVRAVRAVCDG